MKIVEFYYPDFDKTMNILILCSREALNKSEASWRMRVKREVAIKIIDMLVKKGLLQPVRERLVWTKEGIKKMKYRYPKYKTTERGLELIKKMDELLQEYLGAAPSKWINMP